MKKKTSGSFYSVTVQLLNSGKMGIGVKDLADNILAVSMLKRPNGKKFFSLRRNIQSITYYTYF